jgi:hypothetical protein
MPATVHATPVGGPAQSRVELRDRRVEGTVEVLRARLRTDHGSPGDAGNLYSLAVIGLSRIAFVKEFHVDPNKLVVVALDLGELLGYVHSVMIRHLDVSTLDHEIHA